MRSSSKRNSLFQCPGCGTSITVREIRQETHSKSHNTIANFHCEICRADCIVEAFISMKATVYNRSGQDLEANDISSEEINNLF